jgi:hypothetical protein
MGVSLNLGTHRQKMNEGDLWLVIPTATRSQYIEKIIKNSLIPTKNIVLVRTVDGAIFGKVNNIFVNNPEINIQKWWNLGIDYAAQRGAKLVAVLNDDVHISPGSLQAIAFEVLEQNAALGFPYPHSGRLAGYCWILNLDSKVRPDERFSWWFGDNDLQMQAQTTSKYIYVSADIKHIEGGKLTEENELLKHLAERDQLLFIEKWTPKPSNFFIFRSYIYKVYNKLRKIIKYFN